MTEPWATCRRILAEHSKSFSMASRLFPARRRDEVAAFYAWCRLCDDAVDLYRRFTARGVGAREPFVGNGLWVTGVEDPDGFRIDFESPTDVPEETRLSEVEAG